MFLINLIYYSVYLLFDMTNNLVVFNDKANILRNDCPLREGLRPHQAETSAVVWSYKLSNVELGQYVGENTEFCKHGNAKCYKPRYAGGVMDNVTEFEIGETS